jgi:hypothetical protein
MKSLRIGLVLAATMLPFAAYPQGKPAPADAYLYILWPQDGQVIRGAFWCRFWSPQHGRDACG